jgi:DNA-directed RNA polymerase I, II, and III subunit RPABC3
MDRDLGGVVYPQASVNAQKYDRVSRLTCNSNDASLTFTLDVNTELYPSKRSGSDMMKVATAGFSVYG